MRHQLFNGLFLTAIALCACSDDISNQHRYDDGRLHLKLSFNDPATQWKDGSAPHTRALPAVPMTADGMEGITLYLHCEEQDYIEPQTADLPDTRGKRITGEAFDNRKLINSFGLYGIVGSEKVLGNQGTEIQNDGFTYNEDWYEKDSDVKLNFNSSDGWDWEATGDFYAWAPFEAENFEVSCSGDVPMITYTMKPLEADNKDILTARELDLNRSDKDDRGIELEFQHILSAIKFNSNNEIGLHASVSSENPATTFNLKVKTITLKGIYKSGSAPVGGEFTDDGGERTSHWVYEKTDGNKGDCSYTYPLDDASHQTYPTDEHINNDDHCFMVLPQTTPNSDAYLKLLCDVYDSEGNLVRSDMPIQASLSGITWKPGYSYTYKISDTDLKRVINISPSDLSFPASGEIQTFTVTSYLTNTNASGEQQTDGIPETWHPEYYDEETGKWKTGLPKGFVLLDSNGNLLLDDEELTHLPGAKMENGSSVGITYQLEALPRSELSTVINDLQNRSYGTKITITTSPCTMLRVRLCPTAAPPPTATSSMAMAISSSPWFMATPSRTGKRTLGPTPNKTQMKSLSTTWTITSKVHTSSTTC